MQGIQSSSPSPVPPRRSDMPPPAPPPRSDAPPAQPLRASQKALTPEETLQERLRQAFSVEPIPGISQANEASIWGDSIGKRLLPMSLARRLLCVDEEGRPIKENSTGVHAVCAYKGLHIKPNPEGRGYIEPAREYAAVSLCNILSPTPMTAAPTSLVKISGVDCGGIVRERVAQVGMTAGYNPVAANLPGMLFSDLLDLLELFDSLESIDNLPEELEWILDTSSSEPMNAEELCAAFDALMEKLPDETRCLEYKDTPIMAARGCVHLKSKNDENRLHAFRNYLLSSPPERWSYLYHLLEKQPILGADKSLEELIELPRLLPYVRRLFPKASPKEICYELPRLLARVRMQSFVPLTIAEMLLNPTDGKADNFYAEFFWKEGKLDGIQIVGIDNDQVMSSPLRQSGERYYINHKCVLYPLPAMDELIPKEQLEWLRNLDPAQIVGSWLSKLEERQRSYQRLIDLGILKESDWIENGEPSLDIPITLPSGLPSSIFEKIREIKRIASEETRLTLNMILQRVDPVTYHAYRAALKQYLTPHKVLYQFQYGGDVEIRSLLGEELESIIPKLTLPQLAEERPEVSLEESRRAFDMQLASERQQEIGSDALLKAISAVDVKGVREALSTAPFIPKTRGQQHLLAKLFSSREKVRGRFAECAVIVDLLKSDVSEMSGVNPFHVLVDAFNDANPDESAISQTIIRELLQLGAETETADASGRTPLDLTIEQNKPILFRILVELGFGAQANPQLAHSFILHHARTNPEFLELIPLLEKRSMGFAWLRCCHTFFQAERAQSLQITGLSLGELYVKPEHIAHIALEKGRFPAPKKAKERRSVVQIQSGGISLHLKQDPEMPGIELASGLLHRLIFGHGTPLTELFRSKDERGNPFVIQGSLTVQGKDFFRALHSNDPDVALLDHKFYCDMVLMALLTNPEDGKPNNFVLERCTRLDGTPYTRLVSVDNDHSFVHAVDPKSLATDHPQVRFKSILLCLPGMQQPIAAKTRDRILEIDPYQLLKSWLRELEAYQIRVDRQFSDKEQTALLRFDKRNPTLISILLPPGTVVQIYEQLRKIQLVLRKHPSITLMELLLKVDPILGQCYRSAYERGTDPLTRFGLIAENQYGRHGKRGTPITQFTTSQILTWYNIPFELAISRRSHYSPTAALKELDEINLQEKQLDRARSDLLSGNGRSFAKFSPAGRERVLQSIREHTAAVISGLIQTRVEMPRLRLVNSPIKPNQLKRLSHSGLTELRLISCLGIRLSDLANLPKIAPFLRTLEYNREETPPAEGRGFQLPPFPSLKRLILRNCSFSTLDIQSISLQYLWLQKCLIPWHHIVSCPELKASDYSGSQIVARESSEKKVADFCNSVITTWPHLDANLLSDAFRSSSSDQPKVKNSSAEAIKWLMRTWPVDSPRLRLPWQEQKKAVDLSIDGITPLREKLLRSALEQGPTLTEFTLLKPGLISLDAKGVPQLHIATEISRQTALQQLTLRGNLGMEQIAELANGLLSCRFLTYLDLSKNRTGAVGVTAIAALVKRASLSLLSLAKNDLGPTECAILATALRDNQTLTKLDLTRNRIEGGFEKLSDALLRHPNLVKLKLNENLHLPLSAVPPLLLANPLISLSLKGAEIGEEPARQLEGQLKRSSSSTTSLIDRIDLRDNPGSYTMIEKDPRIIRFTARFGTAPAKNLKMTDPDWILSVSNDDKDITVQEPGALNRHRVKVISTVSNHHSLKLAISGQPSDLVVSLVQNLRNATSLSLRSNDLDDQAIVTLTAPLKQSANLTHLDLSSNKCEARGLIALAKLIAKLPLQTFLLANNQIGAPSEHLSEALLELGRAITFSRSLTFIDLTNNSLQTDESLLLVKTIGEQSRKKNPSRKMVLSQNQINKPAILFSSCGNKLEVVIDEEAKHSLSFKELREVYPKGADKRLVNALLATTTFTDIDLPSVNLRRCPGLAAALLRQRQIRRLNLVGTQNWEEAKDLPEAIGKLNGLIELDLSRVSLPNDSATLSFDQLSTLQNLLLNRIKSPELLKGVGNATNLVTLEINGTKLGDAAGLLIAEGLYHLVQLEKLEIADFQFGSETRRHLQLALSKCERLRLLNLSGNDIGEEGLDLSSVRRLEKLSLSGTKLGEQGVQLVVNGLDNVTLTLNELFLSNNSFGETASKTIGRRIASFLKLSVLRLDGNDVRQLLPELRSLVGLKTLGLNNTSIDDTSAALLETGLTPLVKLNRLCLAKNQLGAASIPVLVRIVKQLPDLETLDLRDNPLPANAEQQLRKAGNPKLKVLITKGTKA